MLYMNGLCSAGGVGAACVEWRRRTCNRSGDPRSHTKLASQHREFNDSGSLQLELGLIVQNMQSQCFYTQILSSRSIGEHPNTHRHCLWGDITG